MDGQDGRHAGAVPSEIGGRQSARPVIHMQEVRDPAKSRMPAGKLGGSKRKPGEAQVVVRPVEALRAAIGTPRALIERWRQDDVDDETVRRLDFTDLTWLDSPPAGQLRHD